MSDSGAFLQISGLNLQLDTFRLKDISLSCTKGEYHILMGPSGSGKSTLMKAILGFHTLDSGSVFLGGRDITSELPEKRRMGYVPQNYALFPHLNVEKNLLFALKAAKIPDSDCGRIVDRLCDMLNIEGLRKRKVYNLSGGEKQRVALGRAIGTQPDIILLDEPFSAIDEGRKKGLWFELKQIVEEVGITTLHITHNLEEAYTLGRNLSVLIDGEMVQSGPKEEIFQRPASVSIARYLNYVNIFDGTAKSVSGGTRVDCHDFSAMVNESVPDGKNIKVCIRQQDLKIVREDVVLRDSLKRNVYAGTIVKLFPLPEFCLMWFKIDGSEKEHNLVLKFPVHIKERHDLYSGKKVRVAIWEPSIILFQ